MHFKLILTLFWLGFWLDAEGEGGNTHISHIGQSFLNPPIFQRPSILPTPLLRILSNSHPPPTPLIPCASPPTSMLFLLSCFFD